MIFNLNFIRYHPLCFKKYPPGKPAADFLFGYEGLTTQEKEEIDNVISGKSIKSFPKAKVTTLAKSKKKDEDNEQEEENEDDFNMNFPVAIKKTKSSPKKLAPSKQVIAKPAIPKKAVPKKASPKQIAVKASSKKASKIEEFANKVPSTNTTKIDLEKKPPSPQVFLDSFLTNNNNNNNQNAMKGIPNFPIASTFQSTVPQTALPSMSSEAFFQNCYSDKPCLLDQLLNSVSSMDSSVVISDLVRSKDLGNDLAMWFLYAAPVRTDVAEAFNAALQVYSCNKDKDGFVHTLSCIHSIYFD